MQNFANAHKAKPVPRVRVLDPKFRANARPYFDQCAIATVSIFLILTVLDAFSQSVLVASLGASSFIAFAMPHVESARPRYLVGGVLVGTLVGCGMSVLGGLVAASVGAEYDATSIAFAALATGMAMFLMVITDTEHPPAAALALGFVLNEWDLVTVLVVLSGIVAIASIKEAVKARMIDLL